MKYLSKNSDAPQRRICEFSGRKAFTLAEVMTALVILGLICSGVLVVIGRCAASATDTALRMQAFEVARENMEKLLVSEFVEEGTDFGDSEKYPQIKWQTAVETFYEPITSQMWVKAVCTAEYSDSTDKTQTIELTHWLTQVTDEQMNELMGQDEQEQEWLANQILDTIEEAAAYARVDVQTIEQWINDGLITTEEGAFFKRNLDIYKSAGGKPSTDEKNMQISTVEQLLAMVGEQYQSKDKQQQGEVDPVTGLPYKDIDKKDVDEIFNILKERKR
ncbi:MAG: hypothetical protein A2167_05290 [Planctomycetes bacterium RBG_13_46_10]|nr:MAG: hypothetical protein A2167_05290 [Planctomycetes bacterium RBG_13_46_10]